MQAGSREPIVPSTNEEQEPTECPHEAWALFSAWECPSRDIFTAQHVTLPNVLLSRFAVFERAHTCRSHVDGAERGDENFC